MHGLCHMQACWSYSVLNVHRCTPIGMCQRGFTTMNHELHHGFGAQCLRCSVLWARRATPTQASSRRSPSSPLMPHSSSSSRCRTANPRPQPLPLPMAHLPRMVCHRPRRPQVRRCARDQPFRMWSWPLLLLKRMVTFLVTLAGPVVLSTHVRVPHLVLSYQAPLACI